MFTAIKNWLHQLFGKNEEKAVQPVKTKKKLSRADRKQIEAAIARANRTDKKEKSAQDSIPYERMWPDGICRVSDGHYTKTIQFQDINYQLSQNEDKTAIFEGWCDFLNYFDSSIQFELSFLNLAASEETFARAINIPLQRDDFDSIRVEYTTMLQNQLAKGNNGLIKTKYLTFGIDADSIKAAKPRLERIETDILNNFKRLGVAAETLDGKARLAQLHGIFHMDEQLPFRFEWDWLPTSGLSTKDFIAPSSFEFRTGRQFRMGKKYGAVSFLQILAPELNDRMLADFLDMESSLIVSLHIQSVDQIKAIKTVKRKITDLDKSKIEEQKKAVRAGYDMDIIPSDLATYGVEAKKLLQDLQSRNERMFLVTFLVLNTADNPRQLDNNVFQASSIAQKYNCQLTRLDFQQEEGLMSCLPLGINQIEIQRGLTTSSTAIFVPFTTQELFQNGKEALYYIDNVSCLQAILDGIDQSSINQALANEYASHIAANEQQVEQALEFKARLYESLITGTISKEEYTDYKARYTRIAENAKESIRVLKEKLADVLENRSERNRWISHFTQFSTMETLDRKAVVHMIQSIKVIGKKELEITFTYQDEYQKAIQLIQLAEQTSQRKVG